MIKWFHAGLASPAILKSMLSVTPLKEQMNIMPSGGVSPANAQDWWDAGACVIGMGSNLVGDDVNAKAGSEAHAKAVKKWEEGQKEVARKVFVAARERAGKL